LRFDSLLEDICAICRDKYETPTMTNCNHFYCGNCIMEVWKHSISFEREKPCSCPICRTNITKLTVVNKHVANTLTQPKAKLHKSLLTEIRYYNSQFSAKPVSFFMMASIQLSQLIQMKKLAVIQN